MDQAYVLAMTPSHSNPPSTGARDSWNKATASRPMEPLTLQSEIDQNGTAGGQRGTLPISAASNELTDLNSDVALFARFLAGDDTAFKTLFTAHNQRIFVYCCKLLSNQEQAQDVTQEVWEKMIELRLDPPSIENPVGFLIRVARNKCLDIIKLKKEHLSLSELDDRKHPSEELHDRSEEEEIVLQALKKLPEEQREVLVLNMYSGYRFDEIAEMLGKSPDAIWARASRGRAQLRKLVLAAMSGRSMSNRYTNTGKRTGTAQKEQE